MNQTAHAFRVLARVESVRFSVTGLLGRLSGRTIFTGLFVTVAGMLFYPGSLQAGPYLMEKLDRGMVAIRTGPSEVYVGWRLLGTDTQEVAFNLYRSENGDEPRKLNADPLTVTTDFRDLEALLIEGVYEYSVRALIDGVEGEASASAALAAALAPRDYLRIPLQRPPGGVEGDSSYTYNANDASVGDLTGDGQYEIVLQWEPSNARDSSQNGFTGPVILDAYTLAGARLWRIELGINIRAGAHYTQFMVYDLDGDGRAEVALKTAPGTRDGLGNFIADRDKFAGEFPRGGFDHGADYRNSSGRPLSGPEFMTIFDGRTGAELASTRFYPDRHPDTDFPTGAQLFDIWGDSSGNRLGRIYAGIAYLDGHRPSLIWGRGYAKGQQGHPGRIAVGAWNWRRGELTELWTFDTRGHPDEAKLGGQGAHNLGIADLTGDGKHDIVYGQLWLTSEGELHYVGWGHGDALHISNMDPDRPGIHVFQPHEDPSKYGPNAVSFVDGATGELIWGIESTGDVGRGVAADVDPRLRGYEMWASGGTGGLYNAQHFEPNETLGPRAVQISASKPNSINHVVWWTDDLLRELLDGTTISKWNWRRQTSELILSPPGIESNNGTKANPALQADILGDWREEVIWRESDNTALRVYTTTIPAKNRLYTLMHDHQYRVAVAGQNVGYNQPPHPSYFLGADMDPQPVPNIVDELGAARFGAWREREFGESDAYADETISGPLANPAGDGVCNLLRYTFGLGAMEPALPYLPRIDRPDEESFRYRFRFSASRSDLWWRVEASPDLADWSRVLFDSTTDPDPSTNDGWGEIALPPSPGEDAGAEDALFVRLKVDLME